MATGVIKFRLEPSPTFKAKVPIPIPGAKPEMIEFTFRHRMRADLLALMEIYREQDDQTEEAAVKSIMDCASGWELEDPFVEASILKLVQAYPGATQAVFNTYALEMSGVRRGN